MAAAADSELNAGFFSANDGGLDVGFNQWREYEQRLGRGGHQEGEILGSGLENGIERRSICNSGEESGGEWNGVSFVVFSVICLSDQSRLLGFRFAPSSVVSIPEFCCYKGVYDMQSQVVCNGCRTILLYPRGASNVCCAVCNALTPVPPPGIVL
nr:protein lsd1 [Ipomoea batatas]